MFYYFHSQCFSVKVHDSYTSFSKTLLFCYQGKYLIYWSDIYYKPAKTNTNLSFRSSYSISSKCCIISIIFGNYYFMFLYIVYIFTCRNCLKCSYYGNLNIFELYFIIECSILYSSAFNTRTCKSTFSFIRNILL